MPGVKKHLVDNVESTSGVKKHLVDNVESTSGVKKHLVDNVDGILENKRINLYIF